MQPLLFKDKFLLIEHDPHQHLLTLTWNGFVPGIEFRTAACEIIKAVKKTRVTKLLSDNTNWKIIPPNDQGWAANYWFPKAEEQGILAMATVLSKDTFNRMAERNVEGLALVQKMQIRNFETRTAAHQWLSITPQNRKPEISKWSKRVG